MNKDTLRASWVEINLANLNYNIQQIKKKIDGSSEIIGVIKADAYGHGAIKVANTLRQNNVKTFAVAILQECISLRVAGVKEPIILMGLTPDLYDEEIIKYDITPVISSLENAKGLSDTAYKFNKIVPVFISIDTGMGRIGYMTNCAKSINLAINDIKKINTLPNISLQGIISHFSMSASEDPEYVKLQEDRYFNFINALESARIDIPVKTFANSPAIIENSKVYLDAVRPGIILYGCYPSDKSDKTALPLKPVMSVKANIVHLKEVPEGYSCSYGRKFIARKKSKIGTLSIGYADGLPRTYSAHGKVIVNGHFAPIAGNICMDQCMIDLTDIPDVHIGDEVIIMGSDGNNAISADDIASAIGTINYEVLCSFGSRLPKVYI